jgi:hypothetical protein
MNERRDAVRSLLDFEEPVRRTLARLHPFGWDSDAALVDMERRHVRSVLERYLAGVLTSDDVEEWANAVEMRDDVGHEAAARPLLKEAVDELANPTLNRRLSPTTAQEWLRRLRDQPETT